MMGEVGELCEIFQWRGAIEDISEFSDRDVTHLGEEVADVLIYNVRLADLCELNLSGGICHNIGGSEINDFAMTFETISQLLQMKCEKIENCHAEGARLLPRHAVLAISSLTGSMCQKMLDKTENACSPGLPEWSREEKHEIVSAQARIICDLIKLTSLANLDIGNCVRDKLIKNSKKYPADLVRGSSAKYTAYKDAMNCNIAYRGSLFGRVAFFMTVAFITKSLF